MYTTSSNFKAGMAETARTLTVRGTITYPDTATQAITSTHISTIKINENAGGHLPLGGVSASTLTLKLDNRAGEWNPGGSILGAHSLDGAMIELEIGVYYSGAYQYSNLGVYVLEGAIGQEQEAVITLKGADKLSSAALTAWSDGLTYPQTVIQILTEACSQAGITLKSTSFTNSTVSIPTKPVWDENANCRDVISCIACVGAGFARIDRDGELEIIGFDDTSDYSVTTARYKRLERQGAIFGAFNALSVYPYGAPNGYGATRIADDLLIVDTELNSVAVQSNPILAYGSTALSTLMTNMLTALSGLTFHGGAIDWQGDPSITCGDLVTVTDLDSGTVNLLVLNQSLSFDLGFSMTSGNALNSNVKGQAISEYIRVFTPTGRLNATSLEGDINIRAGNQLNLLSDGKIVVESGGDIDIESGGSLNLSSASQITIGTNPLEVGGTNLIPNSYFDITSGVYGFATTTISGLKNSTEYTLSFRGNVATLGTGTSIRCYIYADDWSYSVYAETQSTTETTAALTFTTPANIEGKTIKFGAVSNPNGNGGTVYLRWAKLEKGNIATDWCEAEGELHNSSITIDSDGIEILSGGDLIMTAPGVLKITGGMSADATAISIRNDTDYFISAGDKDSQADCPFWVKKDGTFKALGGIIGGFAFDDDEFMDSATLGDYMIIQPYAMQIWFGSMYIGQDGLVPGWFYISPNMYCSGAVSAASFTDRTPAYTGNALTALSAVKDDGTGKIDHTSIPVEAQITINKGVIKDGKPVIVDGKPVTVSEPGRDLGMMISILTKAVQELMAVNTEQNARISTLEKEVAALKLGSRL